MTTTRIPDTAARTEARELLRPWDGRPGPLGTLLGRVTPVDKVGVEERVAALRTRSIKTSSRLWALRLAISMVDLSTTAESLPKSAPPILPHPMIPIFLFIIFHW